jgi:hypothetical protein
MKKVPNADTPEQNEQPAGGGAGRRIGCLASSAAGARGLRARLWAASLRDHARALVLGLGAAALEVTLRSW